MKPAIQAVLSGPCAEARQLFDRWTVREDGRTYREVDKAIRRLVRAGVWQKLDVFWLPGCVDNSENATHNLMPQSTTYVLAPTAGGGAAPTFTVRRGYLTNGTDNFVGTSWAPNNGVKYTQNNASVGIWNRTGGNATVAYFGSKTSNAVSILCRNASNQTAYRVNTGTAVTASNNFAVSCFSYNRTASGAGGVEAFVNGASIGTGTSTSAALSSVELVQGEQNSSFSACTLSAMWAGSAMSADEHANLYAVLNDLFGALG